MGDFWYTDGIGRKRHAQESSETYFDKEYKSHPDLISRFKFKDLTHKTNCPKCNEKVYFIRHNGGSVWVDSLGWPWPKHQCFANDPIPKLYTFFEKQNFSLNSQIMTGVVKNVEWISDVDPRYSKIKLTIVSNQGITELFIPALHTVEKLKDTIALVNIESKKILFSSYIESDFTDYAVKINKNKKGVKESFVCPYCSKNFPMIGNLDNHVSQQHSEKWNEYIKNLEVKKRIINLTRCLYCNILVKDIENHRQKVHI